MGVDRARNKPRVTGNVKSGKDRRKTLLVSRITNSVPGAPPKPAPEAPKPGLVGTSLGRTGRIQPSLPLPPPETNGATGKEQKDERGERQPECRCSVGGKA